MCFQKQVTQPEEQQQHIIDNNNENHSTTIVSIVDSLKLDSTSLSGNVGTALYVAHELLTPRGINKFSYSQVGFNFS